MIDLEEGTGNHPCSPKNLFSNCFLGNWSTEFSQFSDSLIQSDKHFRSPSYSLNPFVLSFQFFCVEGEMYCEFRTSGGAPYCT